MDNLLISIFRQQTRRLINHFIGYLLERRELLAHMQGDGLSFKRHLKVAPSNILIIKRL